MRTQITLTIFFVLYLMVVLLTDVSLAGFWTDVVFSVLLSVLALRFVFRSKTNVFWVTFTLRITNIFCSTIVFGLLGLNLINPFVLDTFRLRSFFYQSVDGRLFNAYFKPVGAYAGGYGNFWITEMPKYFPLIEWRVHWDGAVHHDFSDDVFDGEPIDNYEVVRRYIRDKVIDRQK